MHFTRIRRIGKIVLVIVGLLFVATTYRREHWSRYHLDSLRVERRVTTRVLGLAVWSSEGTPDDPYSSIYSQITGRDPDPSRWKNMPPDYVQSLFWGLYRCYGFRAELEARFELFATVYARYRLGASQPEAAAQIRRIDALLPAPMDSRQELDFAAIDALRKELGLKGGLTQ